MPQQTKRAYVSKAKDRASSVPAEASSIYSSSDNSFFFFFFTNSRRTDSLEKWMPVTWFPPLPSKQQQIAKGYSKICKGDLTRSTIFIVTSHVPETVTVYLCPCLFCNLATYCICKSSVDFDHTNFFGSRSLGQSAGGL